MVCYEQQIGHDDDDISLVGSHGSEELQVDTINIHKGSHWCKSRTSLEKALFVGGFLLLLIVTVLVGVMHFRDPLEISNSSLANDAQCLSRDCVISAGDVLRSMDPSQDPCIDFYQYACGGWIAKNPIPQGKSIWGTLNKLASDNQVIMRQALESTEKANCDAEEKARVFYRSCMDVNQTIENLGAQPLRDLIKEAGGWSLNKRWTPPANYTIIDELITTKIVHGSSAFFSWEVQAPSTRYALLFKQGGLTLPARDYYLNESEKDVQDAYVDYISKIVVLLGGAKNIGDGVAQDVMEVEKEIAQITMSEEERREAKYHGSTLSDLKYKAPFDDLIKSVKTVIHKINTQILNNEEIIVYWEPSFFVNLTTIIDNYSSTPHGRMKLHNYMLWHMTRQYIGFLSQDFRDADRELNKVLYGVVGTEEVWRKCVSSTSAVLGPALGAMYVRSAFKKHSKEEAQDMIYRIRMSFEESLASVPWMDELTKKAAIKKVNAIYEMIGYPEYVLDPTELDDKFGDLEIKENEFLANNIRSNTFDFINKVRLLSEPVKRTRWEMNPQTVNAYYAPTKNIIVFPAGILQAPLLNLKNPKALNYGRIGAVIGHEIAHAFDNEGRKFDKDGNYKNWWQKDTEEQFNNHSNCMVKQYSSYSYEGEHLNGKLTLGENIADNGGLTASYRGYNEYVSDNGPDPRLPGVSLSHKQLFYLGFAQSWCSSMTKEAAHLRKMIGVHTPSEFRVIGTLSNSKEFVDVFNCPVGSRMNPANKCIVW